jgi:hypothetical protein
MATKTISLEIDAYDKLRRAKQSSRESFSAVVRRGRWTDEEGTAAGLLEALVSMAKDHPEALLGDEALDRMGRRVATRTRRRRTA